MQESDILIKINGKVHRLNQADPASIKNMAWADRKRLIDLLETIKKAEYVKADVKTQSTSDADFESAHHIKPKPVLQPDSKTLKQTDIKSTVNNTADKAGLDSKIKPSEADVDDLMSRLILEQKQNHQSVPDKSIVYKWFLIVLLVIVGLAVIF